MLKINIDKQKIRQLSYKLRNEIFDRQNLAVMVALAISISWIFSAVGAMRQNYELRRKIEDKTKQLTILEIESLNLEFEQKYFASQEYQDLAARKNLNLASPGEKVLILPPYTSWVEERDAEDAKIKYSKPFEQSNFRKWMHFFFGVKR